MTGVTVARYRTPRPVHADLREPVRTDTSCMDWLPSPQQGVERRPLERDGGEVARATSLVRYAPDSRFPAHEHPAGEEFLVLEGEFGDEHGRYPAGTYVRNPPGSRHAPRTGPGCVIFVKLRQMVDGEPPVRLDGHSLDWQDRGPGWQDKPLYRHPQREAVSLERLAPGTPLARADAGFELLILSGALLEGDRMHGPGTWIRQPSGLAASLQAHDRCEYWIKRGHLPNA